MAKNHLKRITAPKTWPISRKSSVFITKPRPGPHPAAQAVTLNILCKEMLGFARTLRGVKFILTTKEVLVNGRRRRKPGDVAGLFDVVTFPEAKSSYRITITQQGKLGAIPVAGKEASLVPCRIRSKRLLRGGKLQLGFHNGIMRIVEKGEYGVGDTVLLTLAGEETAHFPLRKGSFVIITSGQHVGVTGVLAGLADGRVTVESPAGKVETVKEHVFVIGEKKPAIKVA